MYLNNYICIYVYMYLRKYVIYTVGVYIYIYIHCKKLMLIHGDSCNIT